MNDIAEGNSKFWKMEKCRIMTLLNNAILEKPIFSRVNCMKFTEIEVS